MNLQVDASLKDLAAVLLQDNNPFAFASKALTDVETRYLRAGAYKYGPSNGTSRKIDFAHFWPIDWPSLGNKRTIVGFC